MFLDPSSFLWEPHTGGYELAPMHEGITPPGPLIPYFGKWAPGWPRPASADGFGLCLRPLPDDLGVDFRPYRPLLDHLALCMEFADVKPEPEAIQQFADRYGWLGGKVTKIDETARRAVLRGVDSYAELRKLDSVAPSAPDQGITTPTIDRVPAVDRMSQYELLLDWIIEIAAMRRATVIWRAVAERDNETLKRFLHTSRDGDYYFADASLPKRDRFSFVGWDRDHSARRVAKQLGLSAVALVYVEREINNALTRNPATVCTAWKHDDSDATLALVIHPASLICAMWMQFAQVATGEGSFSVCEECGKWFLKGRDQKRAHAEYCSNACRQRSYRRRKAIQAPH